MTHPVDFRIILTAPQNTKKLAVRVPAPPSDAAQTVSESKWETFPEAGKPALHTEAVFGNTFAHFEFDTPQGAEVITHAFTAKVHQLNWDVDAAKVQPVGEWPKAFAGEVTGCDGRVSGRHGRRVRASGGDGPPGSGGSCRLADGPAGAGAGAAARRHELKAVRFLRGSDLTHPRLHGRVGTVGAGAEAERPAGRRDGDVEPGAAGQRAGGGRGRPEVFQVRPTAGEPHDGDGFRHWNQPAPFVRPVQPPGNCPIGPSVRDSHWEEPLAAATSGAGGSSAVERPGRPCQLLGPPTVPVRRRDVQLTTRSLSCHVATAGRPTTSARLARSGEVGRSPPPRLLPPPVRSAAEAAYRDELRRPPQMAAELAEFARRVFAHPGIMAPRSDRRANDIYALYCGHTGGGEDTRPPSEAELQLFETLGYAVRAMGSYLEGFFQQTYVLDHTSRKPKRLEFKTIREIVERGPCSLPLSTLTDFIHFFPPGSHDRITHRLYLNVPLLQVPQVFMSVQKYMSERHQKSGVCYFKVCGPRSVGQRAETFVVYCRDQASAVQLGQHLAAKHGPAAFALAVPAMTTRVPNTAGGLAVGAEPAKTATGMKVGAAGPREESAQSFGSLRSQLLALAVENYLENGDRVEGDSELDIFNRFVCAAFRGFGLDPMNPGG